MKIKPTPKTGGVRLELGPEESQIPEPSVAISPIFKLQKILVPVDFSECSNKALQYAIPFAKQFGAELILVHTVEPYPTVPEMTPYDFQTLKDSRAQLHTLKESLGDAIPCRISLRKGYAHSEIADAAEVFGADLIIISTHGRKGLSRMVLGSTTEKVVRNAPCPVLIVRQREREFVSGA